ncbi:GPCR fungal pheromone mating factor, partial [Vararia minispora EC-137]
ADPSYPLLPIASITCATLLFLLLAKNIVRKSYNLGVTLLSFWLFWELLTLGINAVVWADNANVRLTVYCDIVSRLQLVTSIAKPACSFIITRKLYNTVVRQSGQYVRHVCLEFFYTHLALPLDYILQRARFIIMEGFGCTSAAAIAGLEFVLIESWRISLPLISVLVYAPRIVLVFYRRNKELNRFLRSNGSVSLDRFFRVIAIACLDIILSLPFGLVDLIISILKYTEGIGPIPFYPGWSIVHKNWSLVLAFRYVNVQAAGTWELINFYFPQWSSTVLGFVIFALFGATEEARATYWR